MRIIQIIDSLDAGGAEKMAVNYANALADRAEFSALIATRQEGVLKNQLDKKVSYLVLNKKSSIDVEAVFNLRKFVKKNKVEIIHAHGTSFFTGFLLKLIYPKIKLIWHEHYGARAEKSYLGNFILIFCSLFFNAVFVVNQSLEIWMKKYLWTKNIYFIPNFTTFDTNNKQITRLKGSEEKRIVCVSNLKKPKNHLVLLRAFFNLNLCDLGWSLHLIGKDYNDDYSNEIKKFISNANLENNAFIYGSKEDVMNLLSQATIGVLCSTSEGFPVTLLEYGLAKLPVISTNVGECENIIKDNFNGLLFEPNNIKQLQEQLLKLVENKKMRVNFGLHLQQTIVDKFSLEKTVNLIISKYKIVLNAQQ